MSNTPDGVKIQGGIPMIQLIVGGKGSGKTKNMIDMINRSAKTTPGNIVCIEKSMKLTYDIDHAARLIDVDEYKISGYDMLYGFVAGILAGNYDIVEVYLDGVLKLGGYDMDGLGALLDKLAALTGEGVKMVVTVSADADALPESVKKFI
jgi:hypothetical protein